MSIVTSTNEPQTPENAERKPTSMPGSPRWSLRENAGRIPVTSAITDLEAGESYDIYTGLRRARRSAHHPTRIAAAPPKSVKAPSQGIARGSQNGYNYAKAA